MTSPLVLVVEDEPELAALVRDYLARDGLRVHTLENGLEVVEWTRRNSPDLVLLDIQLPGLDGLGVCRQLRAFSAIPIILVTARVDEIDRLLGLELGADDYVCKPFSPREVVARVKAVLRRAGETMQGSAPATRRLTVDAGTYRASYGDLSVELTSVELHLLETLLATPDRVFSRSTLMDRAYPDHRVVSDRTIDSHIKKLRGKLAGLAADGQFIHSVYGAGYKATQTPG